MKGHWSRTYHTTNIQLTLIKPLLKEKGIVINFIDDQGITDYDVNFIDGDDALPLIHLNLSEFFKDSMEKLII